MGVIGWQVKAIAAAVLLGAAWYLHNHLIDEGIQRQKDADEKALAEWKVKSAEENGRLKGRAEAAEKHYADEKASNDDYRRNNPLHGRLSDAICRGPGLPSTSSGVGVNAGTGPATQPVLPVLEGDHTGSDQLAMLDLLAGRADQVSAQLREWQSR